MKDKNKEIIQINKHLVMQVQEIKVKVHQEVEVNHINNYNHQKENQDIHSYHHIEVIYKIIMKDLQENHKEVEQKKHIQKSQGMMGQLILMLCKVIYYFIFIGIKNRLKLSEIVYKDSKFKNIKHELSHLFNTYDC